MGNFISSVQNIPQWIDSETRALIEDAIVLLCEHHPGLLAVILYGSIARHDERPIYDIHPSDVDLLAIFATDQNPMRLPFNLEVSRTLVIALEHHLDAPREVNLMLASQTLQEWDETYLANVAHDGIVLYAKGSLPLPLNLLHSSSKC